MMDEQNIPIDINTNKLLEWLVSRRHVKPDWQNSILKIREKINNAIQDMPAHEGIIKLLSGQHINYFHCLKIVEILKETEADSKNLFGRYGSQRMKDWQDIVTSYQKDNVYVAEVSQMLIRNVSFEVPSLRKQVSKLEQSQLECEKKIKDYSRAESTAQKEFKTSCDQLGISGKKIKNELIDLLKDLPGTYKTISEKIKIVAPAVELYNAFNKYLSGKKIDESALPLLEYLIKHGNTTTYEYIYGEKPVTIEESTPDISEDKSSSDSDKIDFGDIDFGDNGGEINFDINTDNSTIDFGDVIEENQNIDWGASNPEEGFEIVTHADLDINLEESGIVVEKTGIDGGVAKGEEALTILDNPKTQEQIINSLMELSAFIKMRLYEMMNDTDMLSTSQMQDAPTIIQMQTVESITILNDYISIALDQLTNKKIQHLHNIKHSPRYLDILTANLNQKLAIVDKMKGNKAILEDKIKTLREEAGSLEPIIKLLIERTKQLQKEIVDDISKKYKGRIVNIIGGVNAL
ncbi:CDK5 regulatory subunit-associated protein 3 [Diabrotica undecimpunctata]|uniref:CDK5 regulatory subunit-associated protein 3 n=1 Tax=Diabrotica undecimpunctata TaxID=50387 RepID=UPI003B641384